MFRKIHQIRQIHRLPYQCPILRVLHTIRHHVRAGLPGVQLHVPSQYTDLGLVVRGGRLHLQDLHFDILVVGNRILLLEG